MLSAQTAAHSRDVCFLRAAAPSSAEGMFANESGMRHLRRMLRGAALTHDAARAVVDAVQRHTYRSQRSLDVSGLREDLCLRRQRVAPQALLALFKATEVWSAIANDLLPQGASLRHVVLPFIADPRELSTVVLRAFAAGITSVEVTFPSAAHAASLYTLDLSEWESLDPHRAGDRLVLWIKCGPDGEGLVVAPQGIDLGVHPLTGVHVPGVQICESIPDRAATAANDPSSPHETHEVAALHSAVSTRFRRLFGLKRA